MRLRCPAFQSASRSIQLRSCGTAYSSLPNWCGIAKSGEERERILDSIDAKIELCEAAESEVERRRCRAR